MNFSFKKVIAVFITLGFLGFFIYWVSLRFNKTPEIPAELEEDEGGLENLPHPLSIQALREGEYPGSEVEIEQVLSPGVNYKRFIASYKSEGLKIYGLLTIPNTQRPKDGWPAIIFNHGYIPPSEYRTTERYVAYQDAFARNGYVTFKSDYRGHGNSEGVATGGYGSNAYVIDVLNALSSIKRLKELSSDGSFAPLVNPEKIGMWGHSMGGAITLKVMVTTKDVKAGVIWAGVVGSYEDLLNNWRRRTTVSVTPFSQARRWREELVQKYGDPSQNPEFWNSISPTSFLSDISGPLQLHHSPNDTHVPYEFSLKLENLMKNAGKEVELYTYDGDDHNLSKNLFIALKRSNDFFDKYLKTN